MTFNSGNQDQYRTGRRAARTVPPRGGAGFAEMREAAVLRHRLNLVSRVCVLCRAGRFDPIWIDEWELYMLRNPCDYASRYRISWEELKELVVTAEAAARKEVA